eukprot:scaffold43092_cov66-Phaeocystis_antarctica.AAC.1
MAAAVWPLRCRDAEVFSAQRVPVAAGGGRGGGGGGRDAAGAYDEFARPRLEQLVALSSWLAARVSEECAGPQTSRSLCTTRAKAGCTPLSSGPCTSSSGCARACEMGGPDRRTGRSP